MRSHIFRNVQIVEPRKQIRVGDVLVRDGRIVSFGEEIQVEQQDTEIIEGGGRLLTPGLIDIHTHGILEFAFDDSPDAFRSAAQALAQYGVTTVVPTIVPRSDKDWCDRLAALADTIPSVTEVNIPGLHFEGPFVGNVGIAAYTAPGDIKILEDIIAACSNRVIIMSLSPETPNILPVIESLRRRNIAVFLTHTRASVARTQRALDLGATHATHFYDGFYPPFESDRGVRPVGIMETILADSRATVDFIADGVHVHPIAIQMAVAAKGYEKVTLITDSTIGTGLPSGTYHTPWGFRVRTGNGEGARHATENYLVGSTLTMNRGMMNLLSWLDLPPEQVWAMATTNPAELLGLRCKGRIEVGADADLVLWEDDLQPAETWVQGRCVYKRVPATARTNMQANPP